MGQTVDITTPEAVASYVTLFKPRAHKDNPDNPKYSCAFIFTLDQEANGELDNIKDQHQNLIDSDWDGQMPYGTKGTTPYIYGKDRYPGDEFYADKIILSASCGEDDQPSIVDSNYDEIIKPSDLYSGCVVKGAIHGYTYKGGTGGIHWGLDAVMKIDDGEALGRVKKDAKTLFGGGGSKSTPPARKTPPSKNTPPAKKKVVLNDGGNIEDWYADGWTDDTIISEGHGTYEAAKKTPPARKTPPAKKTPPPKKKLVLNDGGDIEDWYADGWTDEEIISEGHGTMK